MILEYACLRLEGKDIPCDRKLFLHDAPYNKRISNLRYALTQGIRILGRASKHTFHLLQDTTDASLVYYIGKWTSLAAYLQFRDSKERTELLEILQLCDAHLQWQDFFENDILPYARFRATLQQPLRRHRSVYGAAVVSVIRFDMQQHHMAPGGETLEKTIRKYISQDMLITGKCVLHVERGTLLPASLKEHDAQSTRSHLLINGWANESGHRPSAQERTHIALDCISPACDCIGVTWASPIRLC